MKLITADELREIADGIDNQNSTAEAYQIAISVALDKLSAREILQFLDKARGAAA